MAFERAAMRRERGMNAKHPGVISGQHHPWTGVRTGVRRAHDGARRARRRRGARRGARATPSARSTTGRARAAREGARERAKADATANTMAREPVGIERDVERAETAALLGDGGDASGDARTRARGGTRRGATRTAMAVGGACALAACASIGVWTHRSETLQEAWRPVPGEELAMRATGARGGGGSIARWGTTSAERARLGLEAATGVTPTPTQMTALRALRLQIRNAMFNPGNAHDADAEHDDEAVFQHRAAGASAVPDGRAGERRRVGLGDQIFDGERRDGGTGRTGGGG